VSPRAATGPPSAAADAGGEPTGPAGSGRQLLARADRQAQLLRAAAAAFARGGFAATSMDDVAAEAGVTKLIVYRNFDSKEDLYRSVLDVVSDRLRDEWLREIALPEAERHGFTTRALLTVARENPDGFRLLLVHAAREPQFAPLADAFTERARGVAEVLIADMIPDPVVKAWAGQVIVEYLVSGVLAWLDLGDPDQDGAFIERATTGMFAMFLSWADGAKVDERRRETQTSIT
jgi:AcrR family transcriptional regulator